MTTLDAAESFLAWELDIASDHAKWALDNGVDVQTVALALCRTAGLNPRRMPRTVEDDLIMARLAGVIAAERCREDQRANPRNHRRRS